MQNKVLEVLYNAATLFGYPIVRRPGPLHVASPDVVDAQLGGLELSPSSILPPLVVLQDIQGSIGTWGPSWARAFVLGEVGKNRVLCYCGCRRIKGDSNREMRFFFSFPVRGPGWQPCYAREDRRDGNRV